MINYIIRRLLLAIPTLIMVSIIAFTLVQLPEGDYLDRKMAELIQQQGDASSLARADALRERYGLNKPMPIRYLKWVGGFFHGDFGESFEYEKEVKDLIWEQLGFTLILTLTSMLFTYLIAIPIGIYSATHQHKASDHVLTFMSFLGMSIPSFLLALALIVGVFKISGVPLYGLFSAAFEDELWSWGKFVDMMNHLWIPILVVAINGTATTVRIMRGNLLEIMGRPFITTARAKGLKESTVILKHGVRPAINPLIVMFGVLFPNLISGSAIISIVMGLPSIGPMLLQSLQSEDIYLAGTLQLMMAVLLITGNLVADIMLAWVDPRIRYE